MTPQQRSHRAWILAALEQFEGRLRRYATRLSGDGEMARDAVQHTFLRLCDQREEKVGDRLSAWLFTVCRNKVLDAARKNGWLQALHDDTADAVAGQECDPSQRAEDAELHAKLRVLLDRLPLAQREAVDLWLEGLTYHEITEVTGRSEGAVRVLVHRALTRLREHPDVRPWLREHAETNGAAPKTKSLR